MRIELRPELETFAERRARELGYGSVGEYIDHLLDTERCRAGEGRHDWAWQAIERASGSATSGLTTDEIMEMSRGET